MKAIALALISIFTAVPFAGATTVVLSKTESNGSFNRPDLQSTKFIEYKKRVDFKGEEPRYSSFMTDTRFVYKVARSDEVETYAVVQWIRGCMFESRLEPGRQVEKLLTVYRRHFDEDKVFDHRNWEIDSDTHDPVYTNDSRYSRYALLRWNSDPTSFDPETATFYASAKPPHGTVFTTDLPGAAELSTGDGKTSGAATNSSLEFRTCLFKFTDLPALTTPDGANIDRKKALWCADWSSRFVWSFADGRMTQPKTIDPVCAVQAH